jgi:hypothetical protein
MPEQRKLFFETKAVHAGQVIEPVIRPGKA